MKPDNDNNIEMLKSKLDSNKIDCISFFSPSAVSNFIEFFPGFLQNDIGIAVIGNTTAKRVNEMGMMFNIKSERSISDSLAEAIINYYK